VSVRCERIHTLAEVASNANVLNNNAQDYHRTHLWPVLMKVDSVVRFQPVSRHNINI
jgi:hypothetical protein